MELIAINHEPPATGLDVLELAIALAALLVAVVASTLGAAKWMHSVTNKRIDEVKEHLNQRISDLCGRSSAADARTAPTVHAGPIGQYVISSDAGVVLLRFQEPPSAGK